MFVMPMGLFGGRIAWILVLGLCFFGCSVC